MLSTEEIEALGPTWACGPNGSWKLPERTLGWQIPASPLGAEPLSWDVRQNGPSPPPGRQGADTLYGNVRTDTHWGNSGGDVLRGGADRRQVVRRPGPERRPPGLTTAAASAPFFPVAG